MSVFRLLVGLIMIISLAWGCSPAESERAPAEVTEKAAPAEALPPKPEDGAREFGRPLSDARPVTELGAILDTPDKFDGQLVKTEGMIQRVCQKMGCWMELRAQSGRAVRVPMAGHAFFLPKNVAGRPATVEGRVGVQPLTDEVKDHLKAEGAAEQVLAQAVHIEANGVVIR